MRVAIASLLLGLACNRPAPAPAVDETVPAATPSTVAPTPPPADEPAIADEPPPAPREPAPRPVAVSTARALVLVDGELRRLAADGRSELVGAVPGMLGCGLDDEHGVVWLASARDLSAYDLSDGSLHRVTKGAVVVDDGEGLIWRVQHSDPSSAVPAVIAGNADGLEHCVALVLELGDAPKLRGAIVAEGDRAPYCLAQDADGELVDGKLDDEQAPRKRGYDRAKLVDAKYLVALAARSAPAAAPAPAPPPAPRVKVDVDRCTEEAEACGRAEYLGGERLWWIVVGNSRGDFFHEERLLYDTKTRSWWDPITLRRAARAGAGQEGIAIVASPDRSWGLVDGRILSLAEAAVVGEWAGTFCGWLR